MPQPNIEATAKRNLNQSLEHQFGRDKYNGLARAPPHVGIARGARFGLGHLHELEKEGFVEFVEQRPKGNCLERVVRATARSYVISPAALGLLGWMRARRGTSFPIRD